MNRRQIRPPFRPLLLHNEILGREAVYRVDLCIDGSPGSGKSTLANRFGSMDGGPYNDLVRIRRQNRYIPVIDLNSRPNVKRRGRAVLNIVVEPPANDRCGWRPIWMYAAKISLVVFCFDVNDEDTFHEARKRIDGYFCLLRENCPPGIVLGNKIDLRDDPDRVGNGNIVSKRTAKRRTKEWRVTRYFECSAWENRGVNRLLDYILKTYLAPV